MVTILVHSGGVYMSRWIVLFHPSADTPITQYQKSPSEHTMLYWVVYQTHSGYIYKKGWNKDIYLFIILYGYSPVNQKVIFFHGQYIHFDGRGVDIITQNHVHNFFSKMVTLSMISSIIIGQNTISRICI